MLIQQTSVAPVRVRRSIIKRGQLLSQPLPDRVVSGQSNSLSIGLPRIAI